MIVVALLAATALVIQGVLLHAALAAERARVNDLLTLLESKAAPAEHAAYVAPAAPAGPEPEYLFSEDGLIGIRTEEAEWPT